MKQIIGLLLFLLFSLPLSSQKPDVPEPNWDAERQLMSLAAEGKTIPHGVLSTANNSKISIEDFRGSYIVIDFWATWCAPCIEEAPIFKRMAEKYKEVNVKFISISLDENIDSWKTFISKRSWSDHQYWFGMKSGHPFLSLAYREAMLANKSMVLISLPKYLIISPDGVILNNSSIRPSKPNLEIELLKYL